MKGTEADLGFMLIAAVRYGLGRQSYAPALIAGVVADNFDLLTSPQLESLYEEICDDRDLDAPDIKRVWLNLAIRILDEIDQRREESA